MPTTGPRRRRTSSRCWSRRTADRPRHAVRPGPGRQAVRRDEDPARTPCRRTRSCRTPTRSCSTTYKGQVAADRHLRRARRSSPTSSSQASQLVSTVAGAIPKGKQAITVSLDQTHSVGGFVTPGDRVNVILNFADHRRRRATRPAHKATAFLLPGLKVIAVGSSTVLPQTPTTTQPRPRRRHDHDAARRPSRRA